MTTDQRFWAKIDSAGCWTWTAARHRDGYGKFWDGTTVVIAHRWSYERFVGPIPPGLTLDHLCRNRACVRPSHLEPVTNRDNLLRGDTIAAAAAARTHCPRGHAYDATNTRVTPEGERRCRQCHRDWQRHYKARLRAARST